MMFLRTSLSRFSSAPEQLLINKLSTPTVIRTIRLRLLIIIQKLDMATRLRHTTSNQSLKAELYFRIIPQAIKANTPTPASSKWVLYLEKGMQIIGKTQPFELPAASPEEYRFDPLANSFDFQIVSDKNLNYAWSLYQLDDQGFEERVACELFGIRKEYNQFNSSEDRDSSVQFQLEVVLKQCFALSFRLLVQDTATNITALVTNVVPETHQQISSALIKIARKEANLAGRKNLVKKDSLTKTGDSKKKPSETKGESKKAAPEEQPASGDRPAPIANDDRLEERKAQSDASPAPVTTETDRVPSKNTGQLERVPEEEEKENNLQQNGSELVQRQDSNELPPSSPEDPPEASHQHVEAADSNQIQNAEKQERQNVEAEQVKKPKKLTWPPRKINQAAQNQAETEAKQAEQQTPAPDNKVKKIILLLLVLLIVGGIASAVVIPGLLEGGKKGKKAKKNKVGP